MPIQDSHPELRVRTARLEAEIELQRALLKNLESDRILAQRQLNAVLDPMARLPLEISSEIFLQTRPFPWAPPDFKIPFEHPPQSLIPFSIPRCLQIPMVLLNICHSWTAIALATPALWNSFRIIFRCTPHLNKLLPIWLERTRNRPLSVSLEGVFDQDVVGIIWGYSQQLKHLQICEEDVYNDEYNGELWKGTPPVTAVARNAGNSWL